MTKYRVHFHTVASATVEIEAEDREAAIEAAHDQGLPGICAQCAGWGQRHSMDLGEWEAQDQGFTVEATPLEVAVEEVG